jgi:archaemetzincin
MTSRTSIKECDHLSLCFSSSAHASVAGFKGPTKQQRVAATKPEPEASNDSNPNDKFLDEIDRAFPAPLVLPGDDLSQDPDYPEQSFQEWLDEEERNPVTPKRNKLYVCSSPEFFDGVDFLKDWETAKNAMTVEKEVQPPCGPSVESYLKTFYHGMRTGMIPSNKMRWTTWGEKKKASRKQKIPKYVGLDIGTGEVVRIRIRERPGEYYAGQLNLNDLLDATISMIPKDAYTLLLLVDFDLYEEDEDDFVCGRAYGGSRVAVVSTARYNPLLDPTPEHNVERMHPWPASHCERYVKTYTEEESDGKRPAKQARKNAKVAHKSASMQCGPIKEAVSAYCTLRQAEPFDELRAGSLNDLWHGRVCRTASHEVGHCFGLDHCVYYACVMQSTASVGEDTRQPPYLCPVDLAKVLYATGTSALNRYKALLEYCDRPAHQESYLFKPFAAWIRARLADVEEVSGLEKPSIS